MMENELMIKILLTAWEGNIKKATGLFNALSEEEMYQEIAPGKNRVIYLLGHLAAVHDDMLPLLGLGEKKYEHWRELFISKPDKAVDSLPSVAELKKAWEDINHILSEKLKALTPGEWLQKHTRISEEDFQKEPQRNRLNVLVSRTNHLSYHLGQLVLVGNK